MEAAPTVYHFSLACPTAQQVFLMGPFNRWSTTATPMVKSGDGVWQLTLELDRDGRPAARQFSYFVVDREWMTGRAAFGNTYLLPGSRATVVRQSEGTN